MRGGGEGMSKWILFRWGERKKRTVNKGNPIRRSPFFSQVFLEKKVGDLWEDQKVPRQILRMN